MVKNMIGYPFRFFSRISMFRFTHRLLLLSRVHHSWILWDFSPLVQSPPRATSARGGVCQATDYESELPHQGGGLPYQMQHSEPAIWAPASVPMIAAISSSEMGSTSNSLRV